MSTKTDKASGKTKLHFVPQVDNMCPVVSGAIHPNAPIPQEGKWDHVTEIKGINGFTHGIGTCAPQQGACKLTLNVKNGIIEEALIETIGCSGMTHSAAMASEILPGKTILEALNTDLVCDAINTAMRELFLQIVYGRSQSAFSDDGLPVGHSLQDIKNGMSMTGTTFSTRAKGPRYYQLKEGYITQLALDENNEIAGYEAINLASYMTKIRKLHKQGAAPEEYVKAYEEGLKASPRFNEEGTKHIDPREE